MIDYEPIPNTPFFLATREVDGAWQAMINMHPGGYIIASATDDTEEKALHRLSECLRNLAAYVQMQGIVAGVKSAVPPRRCRDCGSPEDKHPYRHKFVS